MSIKKLYTLITVQSFAGLRDYYCGHFGLSVTMEAPGYLHFSGPGGAELAFMTQDADAPDPFDGKGLLICLEVADVDAKAAQLEKARVPQIAPLRDNPWGDRSVIVRDPVGTHVYVFQAIGCFDWWAFSSAGARSRRRRWQNGSKCPSVPCIETSRP